MFQASLYGSAPPRRPKGLIRDHFGQKWVLCPPGDRSTDVIAVISIFPAWGSEML